MSWRTHTHYRLPRLEAATSRLEDIASSAFPNGEGQNGVPGDTNASGAGVATSSDRTPPQAKPADSLPPVVGAFDELIDSDLKAYVVLSQQLGGVVAEQVWIDGYHYSCTYSNWVSSRPAMLQRHSRHSDNSSSWLPRLRIPAQPRLRLRRL